MDASNEQEAGKLLDNSEATTAAAAAVEEGGNKEIEEEDGDAAGSKTAGGKCRKPKKYAIWMAYVGAGYYVSS